VVVAPAAVEIKSGDEMCSIDKAERNGLTKSLPSQFHDHWCQSRVSSLHWFSVLTLL